MIGGVLVGLCWKLGQTALILSGSLLNRSRPWVSLKPLLGLPSHSKARLPTKSLKRRMTSYFCSTLSDRVPMLRHHVSIV